MLTCATIKTGESCVFMKKAGCSYNGGQCHPVVESCEGCEKVQEYPSGNYCKVFAEPGKKWFNGGCSMGTHVERDNGKGDDKKKINPLKASKRGRG